MAWAGGPNDVDIGAACEWPGCACGLADGDLRALKVCALAAGCWSLCIWSATGELGPLAVPLRSPALELPSSSSSVGADEEELAKVLLAGG